MRMASIKIIYLVTSLSLMRLFDSPESCSTVTRPFFSCAVGSGRGGGGAHVSSSRPPPPTCRRRRFTADTALSGSLSNPQGWSNTVGWFGSSRERKNDYTLPGCWVSMNKLTENGLPAWHTGGTRQASRACVALPSEALSEALRSHRRQATGARARRGCVAAHDPRGHLLHLLFADVYELAAVVEHAADVVHLLKVLATVVKILLRICVSRESSWCGFGRVAGLGACLPSALENYR